MTISIHVCFCSPFRLYIHSSTCMCGYIKCKWKTWIGLVWKGYIRKTYKYRHFFKVTCDVFKNVICSFYSTINKSLYLKVFEIITISIHAWSCSPFSYYFHYSTFMRGCIQWKCRTWITWFERVIFGKCSNIEIFSNLHALSKNTLFFIFTEI